MAMELLGKKVLHICTIDAGGAYNGAKRLNEMFRQHGIDSRILVRTKNGDDEAVYPAFEGAFGKLASKAKNVVNLAFKRGELKRDVCGSDIRNNPLVKEADILFIHWVSTFLSPKQIYELSVLEGKKVYFWMHDMWLFTGGCHVDRRCGGYEEDCRNCPMAGRFARFSFDRKKRYIRKSDIIAAGPSEWIVSEAKKSSILEGKKILYIPNTFDDKVFYPKGDVRRIRDGLGMSSDKKIILFGAADNGTANSNKGFSYLVDALKLIDMSDKQLVVIGSSTASRDYLKDYDVIYKGFIKSERLLADIYRAADVFVNPSLQESFGYTVCEAMACGTPAVAFGVGGMIDQISHKQNGFLAAFKNSNELAEGIEYCLANREILSAGAAISAKRFSYDAVYEYISSIEEMM